jgi:hypothetical protein
MSLLADLDAVIGETQPFPRVGARLLALERNGHDGIQWEAPLNV